MLTRSLARSLACLPVSLSARRVSVCPSLTPTTVLNWGWEAARPIGSLRKQARQAEKFAVRTKPSLLQNSSIAVPSVHFSSRSCGTSRICFERAQLLDGSVRRNLHFSTSLVRRNEIPTVTAPALTAAPRRAPPLAPTRRRRFIHENETGISVPILRCLRGSTPHRVYVRTLAHSLSSNFSSEE